MPRLQIFEREMYEGKSDNTLNSSKDQMFEFLPTWLICSGTYAQYSQNH